MREVTVGTSAIKTSPSAFARIASNSEKRHPSIEDLGLLQVVELPKEEPEAALRLFADIPGMAPMVHTPASPHCRAEGPMHWLLLFKKA